MKTPIVAKWRILNKAKIIIQRRYTKIVKSVLILLFLDVIDQTRGRVFPPISKHREVGWKNEAHRVFLTNFEVFGNRRQNK